MAIKKVSLESLFDPLKDCIVDFPKKQKDLNFSLDSPTVRQSMGGLSQSTYAIIKCIA